MSGKYAFTSTLREVRFHLCHSSPASEATRCVKLSVDNKSLVFHGSIQNNADPISSIDRSFLKRAYPTMKKNNPNIPILIREATGIEPKVWARYGLGPGQTGITQADMVKAMAKKHPGPCQVRMRSVFTPRVILLISPSQDSRIKRSRPMSPSWSCRNPRQ